ncbi:MAG: hypothetical protein K6E68_06370 [Lachnospiraceae bacterium]|nr:hypothetical protein [Lachnospiraceae bacterium]
MGDSENKTNELNEALQKMWDSLTDEQKEQAKECKTMDELTTLAGRMGIELPDELLEQIAGGIIVEGVDEYGTFYRLYHDIGYKYCCITRDKENAIFWANRTPSISSKIVSEQEFEKMRC